MILLFWNIRKNAIRNHIKECILENDVDIAIFTEFIESEIDEVIKLLGSDYAKVTSYGGCDQIIVIAKKTMSIKISQEQDRYVIYNVDIDDKQYLLVGLHLHDRITRDTSVRLNKIRRIVADVEAAENREKCKNTIIIGDFNANPYDPELLQMDAFNAVLFKDIIKKSETHKVDGEKYRRFYNPIVNFISEDKNNYGSYYYTNCNPTPIWHCLDQVIVSKNLVDNVIDLTYLKKIGKVNLIKKIQPDKTISDHLPLLVTIN